MGNTVYYIYIEKIGGRMKDKAEVFADELNFIQDSEKREIIKTLIRQVPDYFFEIPASSTGKYHPKYALGEGGLVRHTKAAVRIANDLLRLEMFNGLSKIKDEIISALLLHDSFKNGETYQKWSVAEHPIIAGNFVMNALQGSELAYQLCDLISTHMGQFNTDYKSGKEVLPKPNSKAQAFVHLCDYLASRKFLEFNFEV